ncbi:MAG TPA: (Fe-S)-binding protein [Bellilinea sp.]|nr:(Fe-S)-binding protein [Bellilinea sp.]
MLKHWLSKLLGQNTLYYPGCVTQYALPEVGQRYENLLRRAGVDFIMLPGETLCCGSPVKRAGYFDDYEELKRKNIEIFTRFSVGKIITNCPGCYHTLKFDYGLNAYHVTQVLFERRGSTEGQAHTRGGALTFHDPCHLGRWSEIYEEPRRLLSEAGWAIEELPDNREHSLCCGAGGGVKSNFPDLANGIARQRLRQVSNGRLCTACPLCYSHFKENAENIEIFELSEALTTPQERRANS